MKKTIITLFFIAFILSLCACSGARADADTPIGEADFSLYNEAGDILDSPNEIMPSIMLTEYEDAQTYRGIQVGSTTEELLAAYPFTTGNTAYADQTFQAHRYEEGDDLKAILSQTKEAGNIVILIVIVDENDTEADAYALLGADDARGYKSLMFVISNETVTEVSIQLYY